LQKYIKEFKQINLPFEKIENFYETNFTEEEKIFFEENLKKDYYYNMLEFIERENKKVVYTIENPIEMYFKSKNLFFLQHDVETHFINPIDSWLKSKRSNIK
jgi:hypothetical protein